MAGNAVIGGLIGVGVDVSTGAMLDLTPNPAHVDLTALYQSRPSAPSQAAIATNAAMSSNLVLSYSDYIDEVTAQVQSQMRSRLSVQAELIHTQNRSLFDPSFASSVEAAPPFIRQRIVRVIATTSTATQLANPESMTDAQIAEMRRQVRESQRGISATLIRSAWVRACGEAGSALAQDCAVYLSLVETDLNRLSAEPFS